VVFIVLNKLQVSLLLIIGTRERSPRHQSSSIMARGKNYVNNNRGVSLQSSRKTSGDASSQILPCKYGAACQRKDCVYRHPPSNNNGNSNKLLAGVCVAYLAGNCSFKAKGCNKRHPPKEECERLRARYKNMSCRFGDECRTNGCLYRHPRDKHNQHGNGNDDDDDDPVAFIEPSHFPPLSTSTNSGPSTTTTTMTTPSSSVTMTTTTSSSTPVMAHSAWTSSTPNPRVLGGSSSNGAVGTGASTAGNSQKGQQDHTVKKGETEELIQEDEEMTSADAEETSQVQQQQQQQPNGQSHHHEQPPHEHQHNSMMMMMSHPSHQMMYTPHQQQGAEMMDPISYVHYGPPPHTHVPTMATGYNYPIYDGGYGAGHPAQYGMMPLHGVVPGGNNMGYDQHHHHMMMMMMGGGGGYPPSSTSFNAEAKEFIPGGSA
jgi:hypothetical protein